MRSMTSSIAYGLDWVIYGEFSGIKLLIGHGEKEHASRRF